MQETNQDNSHIITAKSSHLTVWCKAASHQILTDVFRVHSRRYTQTNKFNYFLITRKNTSIRLCYKIVFKKFRFSKQKYQFFTQATAASLVNNTVQSNTILKKKVYSYNLKNTGNEGHLNCNKKLTAIHASFNHLNIHSYNIYSRDNGVNFTISLGFCIRSKARKKKLQEMDKKPIHVYIEHEPERFVQTLEVSYIQQNYTSNSYKHTVSCHKNTFLLKVEP